MKKCLAMILFAFFSVILSASTKNSFQEVTKYLQKDGEFYFYLSTNDIIKKLQTKLDRVHKTLNSLDADNENKENIENGFTFVNKIIQKSGIYDITGIGASTKKNSAGIFENKLFIHHYPEKNTGLIWKIFGIKPHNLEVLSLLPADTVAATYQDFDFESNWKLLHNSLLNSNIPPVKDGTERILSMLNKLKVNLDPILSSINGAGVIITMDKTKKLTVPIENEKTIQIDKPGIILFFKTKDDSLFKLLQSKLIFDKNKERNLATFIEENNKRTLKIKINLPYINTKPVVVQTDKYILIASEQEIVDNALSVQSGKIEGLVASDELKLLSKGISLNGNGFNFTSSRIQKVITEVQKAVLKGDNDKILQKLIINSDEQYSSFYTYANLDNGLLVSANSCSNLTTTFLSASLLAPIGVLSATLLPGLSRAREAARKISCINNLKQIGLACKFYAESNNDKYPVSDGPAGLQLLRPFIENPKVFVCPSDDIKCAKKDEALNADTVSYIYFGGFTDADDASIPIAFDKPGNHKDYCNVLFLDGHAKGFCLKDYNTCKDIIEYLIAKNDYTEEVKAILRKKAAAADSINSSK